MCGVVLASSATAARAQNQLAIYPAIEGLPAGTNFRVSVRNPGQAWREVQTYRVKVSQGVSTEPPVQRSASSGPDATVTMGPTDSSISAFDFSGTVEVSVKYNAGQIHSVRIRPLSFGISPVVKGNTISFSLSRPRNLSIEINGDIFHNLQLLASPIETSRADPADLNVIYYGPGVHQVGRVAVPSGTTVYLAAGALVEGSFSINHAENIRIIGRGILSQAPSMPRGLGGSRHDAILIEFAKNVEVDGIILVPNSYSVLIGQSQDVAIRNIKSFSAGGNNDGIDVFDSSNILIDGVFMRNSDDNIAIYGHRWNYYGDTRHVTVQNSTLWADVAHPILVGTHGDSTNPDTLEDLHFINLDILDQREPQLDYQGCMSLNAGDSNLIRDVSFENIRVEDFREGQLLNLRVFFNKKYNTSPGGGIENVTFKDVTYTGTHANPSIIAGYDDARQVRNIVFENLTINGRVISDNMAGKPGYFKTGDMGRIFLGEHVENVTFRTVRAGSDSDNTQMR